MEIKSYLEGNAANVINSEEAGKVDFQSNELYIYLDRKDHKGSLVSIFLTHYYTMFLPSCRRQNARKSCF